MVESYTFKDDSDENEMDGVVDFVALLMAKQKETREAQIDGLATAFAATLVNFGGAALGPADDALLIDYVRQLIERAYLNADVLEAKTRQAIEQESCRRARVESG